METRPQDNFGISFEQSLIVDLLQLLVEINGQLLILSEGYAEFAEGLSEFGKLLEVFAWLITYDYLCRILVSYGAL